MPKYAQDHICIFVLLEPYSLFTDFPATGVTIVDSVTDELRRSPKNPDLGDDLANLARSQGFKGMKFSPDCSTFYPLLEGNPKNTLRINEFDCVY